LILGGRYFYDMAHASGASMVNGVPPRTGDRNARVELAG
jgi:hypothetical protein